MHRQTSIADSWRQRPVRFVERSSQQVDIKIRKLGKTIVFTIDHVRQTDLL
jgi:hypothetical protein